MARRKGIRKQRTLRTETYGKGSVYQDKKGAWWYQPPAENKQRLPRIRAASEQAARLAQKDHLAKLEQKVKVTGIPTVAEWFDFWFREHVAPGLKPKTLEWYRYIIEHYIISAIGDVRLDLVDGDMLVMLKNRLSTRLGVRLVSRICAMMDRAFKKAVVSHKIRYNPMDAVDAPRVPRSKQRGLEPAHVQAFRDAIAGHRNELMYDLAFMQGFRRGELLGFLISEYDSAKGTLTVSGQVQTIAGATARQGTPKSDNSERVVPLTPRQRAMMDDHLARLSEERRRLGMEWKEHGLLFPSERGTPIIPRNFNRQYYQTQARAKIPHYSFHATRHTAASRLNAVKATPRVIQGILGHGAGTVSEGYMHPELWEMLDALEQSEAQMLRRAA